MASNVEAKEQGRMKLYGGARRGGRTWRPGMINPAVPGRRKPNPPGSLDYIAYGDVTIGVAPQMYGSGSVVGVGKRTATGAEMMLAQAGTRMREEIPHLDTASVVQYKYAMMSREHRKLNPDNNRRDLFFDMKSCSVPDLFTANAKPTLFSSALMAFDPVQTNWMGIRRGESVTVVRWACTSLRGYEVAVPDFARSKALQIARALPGVEFFVEELREDQLLIDPFLIATLGDEQFYIEVWGEPEFESQMEHNQV